MKIVTDFPFEIQEIENLWIPLPDGTRLAAKIWLPLSAADEPVPAILEYIPYRKSDLTAYSDSGRYRYLAGHGYVCVRVDIRGSGDSDGILRDEYSPQEQEDAVYVIDWLAKQSWCSGRVGMMGISWGGFNALQVAAHRPAALKAIVTVCSTDDRYADDVHFMGGCVQSYDALPWATTLLGFTALPPNPQVVGDSWKKSWLNRLENATHFIDPWLSNQHRNDYWKQGSVCEDFSTIACPVYAIGGWADGYTNTVFRLIAGLTSPSQGLIGPWSHAWPHESRPGPSLGFLQEVLRWWDFWLKDIETGIMNEPKLRVWMQESIKPAAQYRERPGRWICEPSWPPLSRNQVPERQYLNANGLFPEARNIEEVEIPSDLNHGIHGGVWCPFGSQGDLPDNQKTEDEYCLCFDTEPAKEITEILGHPMADLTISADRPVGQIVVRLCDVAADGSSLLVTRGALNLTHFESHQDPKPLVPGEWFQISLKLDATAHSLPTGHKWRLAIGTSYWPIVWPSPEPVMMNLKTGSHSWLTLPVRQPQASDDDLSIYQSPESAAPIQLEFLKPPASGREVSRDHGDGSVTIQNTSEYGRMLFENGQEFEGSSGDTYNITKGEPNSASIRCRRRFSITHSTDTLSVDVNSEMRSVQSNFNVKSRLQGFEGENQVFDRNWERRIPRKLV